MKRALEILKIYFNNTGFRWLLGFVCLGAGASRILYFYRSFELAEEFFTLLFIVVLWLFFHMGILLKYQFGNSRASLMPGYRRWHIVLFLIIYVALIIAGLLWQSGMPFKLPWMSSVSMVGSLATCFMISLFVMVLGYLSMGRFLLYGYCFVLMVSVFSMDIIDVFDQVPWMNYVPIMVWLAGIVFFVMRLGVLREECLEYGHVLTWPPKNARKNFRSPGNGFLSCFQKKCVMIMPFPKTKSIMARLRHWGLVDGGTPSVLNALLWVTTVMYLFIFLKVAWAIKWLQGTSEIFLMYVLTPLVILAIFYYRRMIFWGYDIIRPVSRSAYFRDQAVVVFAHVFMYWLFTVLALAVIPRVIFHIGPELSLRQLLFFVLSGSFVFLITAVVSVLSAIDSAPRIIFNGGVLCCLAVVFFDIVPDLNITGFCVFIWACLASGLVFIKNGYHAWCHKEYS